MKHSISAWAAITAALIIAASTPSRAQEKSCVIDIPKQLTFEQWKAEVLTRAERQIYPLIGIKADEVRAALPQAKTPDCDAWARIWITIGDRYFAKAKQELPADRVSADADFSSAWRYYSLARWPTLLSPAKREAWTKAKEAFNEHGKLMDPPVTTLRIPFAEGRDIVGYLRVPKVSGPVPFVITIGGLDAWGDDMTRRFAALPENGFAYLALDAPGTGDSPVKGAGEEADRMFAKVLDWAQAQPNFDKTRIFVHGGSMGGYWSSRLAILEAGRIRGAIDQSGPIDLAFNVDAIHEPKSLAPSFYLSDGIPSVTFMLGTKAGEDTDRAWRGMSLREQGLLGKPTAPMLVVGGAKDPLIPNGDLFAMLTSGKAANEAWIHPDGMHMGRVPGVWRDEELLTKVMLPWLKRQAATE
ncbi:MAG: yellowish-green 1-like protein [Tardiphaga sp.]|nr:yellowish-green 1-like protein [Tardiphaga sp.]